MTVPHYLWLCSTFCDCSSICLECRKAYMEIAVQVTWLSTRVWTRNFPNTNQELYPFPPPTPNVIHLKYFARVSGTNNRYPMSCGRRTKRDKIKLHSCAGIHSCEIWSSPVFEYYSLPGYDIMWTGEYRPLNGVWFPHLLLLGCRQQFPPKCGMYMAR